MVEQLRQKQQGARLPVAVGDMADIDLTALPGGTSVRFGLVFVAINTFFNLTSADAQARCLRRVHNPVKVPLGHFPPPPQLRRRASRTGRSADGAPFPSAARVLCSSTVSLSPTRGASRRGSARSRSAAGACARAHAGSGARGRDGEHIRGAAGRPAWSSSAVSSSKVEDRIRWAEPQLQNSLGLRGRKPTPDVRVRVRWDQQRHVGLAALQVRDGLLRSVVHALPPCRFSAAASARLDLGHTRRRPSWSREYPLGTMWRRPTGDSTDCRASRDDPRRCSRRPIAETRRSSQRLHPGGVAVSSSRRSARRRRRRGRHHERRSRDGAGSLASDSVHHRPGSGTAPFEQLTGGRCQPYGGLGP